MQTNPLDSRILVVDDDPLTREFVRFVLELKMGVRVLTASSGAEALFILSYREVSLVITDLNMPVMSGWELLREVGRHYPHVQVIVMSGNLEFMEGPEEILTDLGAKAMLSKNELATRLPKVVTQIMSGKTPSESR